jgi:hypothetical protein
MKTNDYALGLYLNHSTKTYACTGRSLSKNKHYKVIGNTIIANDHVPLLILGKEMSREEVRFEKQYLIEFYNRRGYTKVSQES